MNKSVIATAASLFLATAPAFGCSMPPNWSLTKEFKKSAFVFRAVALRTEAFKPTVGEFQNDSDFDLRYVRVHFEIQEFIKGNPPKNGYAMTNNGYFGGCAVPILAGVPYVVFIDKLDADAAKSVDFTGSMGVISDLGTEMLPQNPSLIDEAMKEIRNLSKTVK